MKLLLFPSIRAIALVALEGCKDHRQPKRTDKVLKPADTTSQPEYVQYDTSNSGRITFDSVYKKIISDSGKRFDEAAMILPLADTSSSSSMIRLLNAAFLKPPTAHIASSQRDSNH